MIKRSFDYHVINIQYIIFETLKVFTLTLPLLCFLFNVTVHKSHSLCSKFEDQNKGYLFPEILVFNSRKI